MVYMPPYSIDAVARLTGISPFTLRNWEARYSLIKPKRMRNGFRTYNDENVELLKRAIVLLRHGARIGDLAKCVRQSKGLPEIKTPRIDPTVESRVEGIYQALINLDLRAAEAIHATLSTELKPARLLELVYSPLLALIDQARNEGTIGFAQERFASKFVRLRLAHFLTRDLAGEDGAAPAKKAVFATTRGELNENNQLLVAAGLRLRGWSSIYLGGGFPMRELGAAVKLIQPRLLCLAFSDWQGIRSALGAISRFDCEVCIGGAAALTFDPSELPSHVHLFMSSGHDAADALLSCLTPSARSKKPRSP